MTTSLLNRVKAATAEAPAGAGRPAALDLPSAPEGTEPATVESETAEALHTWLNRYEDHIGRRLPKHMEPGAFLAAVRDRLPELERCSPASILDAVLACASFGLVPDGAEAVLTREGPVAVFIPTYRGYLKVMHNSGVVTSVRTGLVYPGDELEWEPSAKAPDDFKHRPKLHPDPAERGEPSWVYAFAWLQGGDRSETVLLSRQDVEEIRDKYSRAYQRAVAEGRTDTFWHTNFWDMALKSAIRRLPKRVPVSAEVRALAAVEDAAEEGRPQLGHAPDPEAVQLNAEAERAATAAEASQDVPPPAVPGKTRRRQPVKKSRGRRRAEAARGRA